MPYSLSFSDSFFVGESSDPYDVPARSDRPTSVLQALASMPDHAFASACRSAGLSAKHLESLYEVIAKIQETDTCSNLDSPFEVWIDSEGYHTVLVYGSAEANPFVN